MMTAFALAREQREIPDSDAQRDAQRGAQRGDRAGEPPAGHDWHVLYVKSRQEKALADELSAVHISHFLPLVCQARFYGRRKKRVHLPLFPGYLFIFGTLDDVYWADRTKRVARVLPVPDQRQMSWELKNLQLALGAGATLRTHPYLRRGTRVEVGAGPLRGVQGIVEDATRPDRLILQVQMLARAVSLEIDGAMVNPVL